MPRSSRSRPGPRTAHEKLDAIGVLCLDEQGKVKDHKLGKHTVGKGAGIGLVLALATPVGWRPASWPVASSGRCTHKGLGLTDDNREQLGADLKDGKAAVGVLVEPHEADVLYAKLTELGGTVKLLPVSDEALAEAARSTRRVRRLRGRRGPGPRRLIRVCRPAAADACAVTVSAIVLAGGRSTRFGRDKLAEPLDGVPLLWRTIEAVRAVADDIVVVVAPGSEPELPADVRVAYDPATGQGPLVGVLAGLEAVRHDTVLVVGGDMPWLRPRSCG